MAAREPRPRCAGPFLLAPRQHEEADHRAGDRQHLCARSDGDGQRAARPRRAVGRTLSARRRRVACAVGRGRARPYLREAGDDDARLSRWEARGILGPGKLLCPEVWVLLERDPAKARALSRQALANYLRLDNYVNNWRRLGFGDDDFAGGGSDRFVDANVAWGGESAIRKRIAEHWEAGADHVCIQSISPDGSRRPDEKVLALLAPARRS